MKVLIVEDNPDHRLIFRKKLEAHYQDIVIHNADCVHEAVQRLESQEYQTVLLDYRLKGQNGIDLVKWIKGQQIDTPVIMITSMEDVEVAVQAIKLGVYDYICKNKESLDKLPFLLGKVIEEYDLKSRLKQAELKYHTLINGMDEAVFMMDASRRFVYLSQSVERLFGYPEEEFGALFPDLFLGGDQEVFDRNISSVLAGRKADPFVVRLRRRDGSEAYTEINAALHREGEELRVVGTLQDVSKRVALEQAVESEQRKIGDIFNSIIDWIYIVDQSYNVTFMNKSLVREIGEPEGRKCYQHLYGSRAPCSFCKLPSVITGKTVRWELRRENGRTFDIISSPLSDRDGSVGKLEILRDITRRKEAEEKYLNQLDETVRANDQLRKTIEQLKRMQEQLVQSEKLAAIGQLVSGVAHELNNPLFSALGNTELLLMEDSDPEQRRSRLEAVLESIDRARLIVKDLLQFAHREQVEKAPVSIAEMVEKTVTLRSYDLSQHHVQVRIDVEEDLPPVRGNFVRLQQVFLNILINAEHAITELGKPGTVVIEARADGRQVVVSIANDGPPIPPEILGNIFDPFFTTREVGRGTGLGLSTSYGILKDHGGDIAVQSTREWTTFTITLPADESPREPAAGPAGGRVCTQPELYMLEESILVVDNEPIIVRLLQDFLEKKGYAVVPAVTGAEAVEKLEEENVTLVVSDINLSDMDGRRLYRAVTEKRPELAGRLLFITGGSPDEPTASFLEETGVGCLKKPFSFQEITSAIDALAGKVSPRKTGGGKSQELAPPGGNGQ